MIFGGIPSLTTFGLNQDISDQRTFLWQIVRMNLSLIFGENNY
jgi:hypothetical protein